MASSSSSSLWNFDVFLSFRGEDTRTGFVSHLYKEFKRKGLKIFRDDEELQKGRSISPELLQAIRESKFVVVVISQNYASSSWCLDELLEIVKCEEKGSLKIFPVFYEVDPSDVKKQNGPFKEPFQRHEDNPKVNPEKVQQWKEALRKVATTAGEDSRNWNDHSDLIEEIVSVISGQLISITASDFSDLVGMDHHMAKLYDLLDLDSTNEVRMIGIWGMPGVGKTMLARYIYETICQHFQTHCFVEDVKKFYREDGPKRLQEKLLTTTLGGALTLRSSVVGSNVIKARLGHQKVLIVIDDVDEIEQLNVLAKDTSWFGSGSRIIITTQDKHLFIAYGIEHIYEVPCLSWDSAIQLFSLHAFNQKQPLLGFEQLSRQATHYAGGLPLALRVLGSSLCGRSRKEWESILSRCERSLDQRITDILKIGYDGLNKQEKSFFLHIACLFDGVRVEDVSRVLNDDHEDAKYVIQILAEKSFIDIHHGNIKMHGLLQKMGRKLVQDADANCKLLINHEEICDALTSNKVNKKIEGICLDMSQIKKRRFSICDGAFERINNLKFLKIYNNKLYNEIKVHLPSNINLTNCKLRYLRWDAYPWSNLPFRVDCLVVLNMCESELEKLWEGSPSLMSLRRIDLSCSRNLREIPDLSKAPNLEHLDLHRCDSLIEVPSSIKGLNKLVEFLLTNCSKLVRLPGNVNLKSLQTLKLGGCERLKGFPRMSLNIKSLYVSLTSETELPDSIGNLSYLVNLGIYKCKRLKRLPTTVGNLRSLECMILGGCEMLEGFPNTIKELLSLKEFHVYGGQDIRKMPRLPPNIEKLSFEGTSIEDVPSWIGNLSRLSMVDLTDNKRLKNLPASISILECLECLILHGCSSLEIFPTKICRTTSPLTKLDLLQTGIKELPNNLGNMTALRTFSVPKITREKGLLSIVNLRILMTLHVCQDFYEPDGEPILCPSLEGLSLLVILQLRNLNMVEIPEDLGNNLPYLEILDLSGNDFQAVPASIKHLTRLRDLSLNNCRNLRSLPQVSCSVEKIHARGCVSLKSATSAFDCSLAELDLSGCIQLGHEAQSLAQHLASRAPTAEKFRAWLPVSEIPKSFKHQAKGSSLTIHLPRSLSIGDVSEFVLCIIIASESSYNIGDLRLECTYDFKDNDDRSVLGGFLISDPFMYMLRKADVEGEHLVLVKSRNFRRWLQTEACFQHIHISFDVHVDYRIKDTSPHHHHVKVKACGFDMVFKEDIDLDDEFDDIATTSKTFDDEPGSANKRQEFSNEKQYFQSVDNEQQDANQMDDVRNQNLPKFLCCICDVIFHLFSH